jgi:hypothetical protein
MLQKAISTALILLLMATSAAYADALIVDGISKAGADQPERGLTKAAVASKWGEPAAENSAVGEPAISSWEYANFVVYFEADNVLHSVAKR